MVLNLGIQKMMLESYRSQKFYILRIKNSVNEPKELKPTKKPETQSKAFSAKNKTLGKNIM